MVDGFHGEGGTEPSPLEGGTVKIGAWLAKARPRHRSGRLPEADVRLVAALFDGDWAADDAVPAALV
ncbi:hypothetical protein JK361_35030 [Streptomyces sp. 5-8]|uniref:Uncharacterized protein n=1 Tax=Streptomyces musisoli TaxID=2802280 RepID=A0ABS1PCE8_9ACTN|nr:hypothetical protein [Streptomyces musisoli]MBL1109732.1 hypothetical protein [Streptomyces musisoli]